MPNNAKRKGNAASTSFRRDEVMVGCQVFEILLRGGDLTVVIRSDSFKRMVRKFTRMKESILEGRQGGEVE